MFYIVNADTTELAVTEPFTSLEELDSYATSTWGKDWAGPSTSYVSCTAEEVGLFNISLTA